MSGEFDVDVVKRGDEVVLVVAGEVDAAATGSLDAGLVRAQDSDASVILVDLDRVEFFDAAALHVIVRHAAEDRDRRRLRFTQGSASVRRLISLAGVCSPLASGC